ncbi:MAG: PilN domain-containing protein [bacterium]|nr:PilN domain-containing protein [bacterium]
MVKQFSINLNKSEGHAEREARWRKRREVLTIVLFLILFGVISLYTWRSNRALADIISAKQHKIAEIDKRLEEMQRAGKNISKNDVLTLARMEKERFLWTAKLKALADILPQDVVLTLLEFNNRQLRIKAISKILPDEKEFDKVSQFMEMLKSTPFFYREFTNIRFSESHRVRVEDQEILSITITCSIEKPVVVVPKVKTTTTAKKSDNTPVKGVPEP